MQTITLTAAQRGGLRDYLADPQKQDHWSSPHPSFDLLQQVDFLFGEGGGCDVVVSDGAREFLIEESERAAHHIEVNSEPSDGNALYRALVAKSVPRARGFLAACDAILARPELEAAA